MFRKYYSPDESTSKAAATTVPDPTPQPSGTIESVHKSLIPSKQADFAFVCKNVSADWANHPELKLIWVTQTEFATLSGTYYDLVKTTTSIKGAASSKKSVLDKLDDKMNEGGKKLKVWLKDKFGSTYTAEFGRYGIYKKGKKWDFPTDRETKQVSIDLITAALQVDGFDKKADYGLDFWKKLKDDYTAALGSATDTSTSGHEQVGNKTELKKKLKEILKSLLLLIQANYRDKYYSVALGMGFRKQGQ